MKRKIEDTNKRRDTEFVASQSDGGVILPNLMP